MALLLRAADLSPQLDDRKRRSVMAAYIGVDVTGDMRNIRDVLEPGVLREPPSLVVAVAGAAYLLNVARCHRYSPPAACERDRDVPGSRGREGRGHRGGAVGSAGVGRRSAHAPELVESFRIVMARLRPEPPELIELLGSTYRGAVAVGVAGARPARRRGRRARLSSPIPRASSASASPLSTSTGCRAAGRLVAGSRARPGRWRGDRRRSRRCFSWAATACSPETGTRFPDWLTRRWPCARHTTTSCWPIAAVPACTDRRRPWRRGQDDRPDRRDDPVGRATSESGSFSTTPLMPKRWLPSAELTTRPRTST